MKKSLLLTLSITAFTLIQSSSAFAGTEYYTDENGFTQERWVDENSNDSYNSGNNSEQSAWRNAGEVVKEAWDHMNDQGKARQIQDELNDY